VVRHYAYAVLLLVAPLPALADPGYYVVSAYDNEGMGTVDFRYWTVRFPGSPATIWPEVGIGYGVTSRWFTEVYASYVGSSGTATRVDTFNWQNEYLLTQGQYPFDLALHASLIRHEIYGRGWGLEWGPVVQTDVGRTQLNANLFVERGYGDAQPAQTQMKYQWQVKYRWRPLLQFGAQGFGELGPWDRWAPRDRQSHRAGPAAFGKIQLGDGRSLSYQAAYLVGSVYGRHGDMFSMRIQYGF
jgi:hypothetical protein